MTCYLTFRQWLNQKWYEHVDELASYNQSINYDLSTYFYRYKWWLKREYLFYKKTTLKNFD